MKYAIETFKLRKIYRNGVEALKGVTFKVKMNEIIGYIGPNGAGKTTTINILATIIKPTSGNAYVLGFDVVKEADEIRSRIGLLAQETILDYFLTVYENLYVYAWLQGIEKSERIKRIKELLKDFDLYDKRNRRWNTLSTGEARRAALARALIHEPEILFIDEPTLGLDPYGKSITWNYLKELRKKGVTIFLASNQMEEIQALCDRVIFIHKGEILEVGHPEEIIKKYAPHTIVEINLSDIKPYLVEIISKKISSHEGIERVEFKSPEKLEIHFNENILDVSEVLDIISKLNMKIKSSRIRYATLNDAFIEIVKRSKNYE